MDYLFCLPFIHANPCFIFIAYAYALMCVRLFKVFQGIILWSRPVWYRDVEVCTCTTSSKSTKPHLFLMLAEVTPRLLFISKSNKQDFLVVPCDFFPSLSFSRQTALAHSSRLA